MVQGNIFSSLITTPKNILFLVMQAVSTITYMYTYKFKVDFVLHLINIQTPVMQMAGKHDFHYHYPIFDFKTHPRVK
jgi:hypothetical protein